MRPGDLVRRGSRSGIERRARRAAAPSSRGASVTPPARRAGRAHRRPRGRRAVARGAADAAAAPRWLPARSCDRGGGRRPSAGTAERRHEGRRRARGRARRAPRRDDRRARRARADDRRRARGRGRRARPLRTAAQRQAARRGDGQPARQQPDLPLALHAQRGAHRPGGVSRSNGRRPSAGRIGLVAVSPRGRRSPGCWPGTRLRRRGRRSRAAP